VKNKDAGINGQAKVVQMQAVNGILIQEDLADGVKNLDAGVKQVKTAVMLITHVSGKLKHIVNGHAVGCLII